MLIALRFLHVVGGVLWVGALMFVVFFLLPAIRSAGPAGGAVMMQLTQVRRMPVYMMSVALATVLSGIGLIVVNSAGAAEVWMSTGPGRVYGWGGLLAILGMIIGFAVNMPASRRMSALGVAASKRGGPPTAEESAEMQRLQGRLARASLVVAILLLIATTLMAVARYV